MNLRDARAKAPDQNLVAFDGRKGDGGADQQRVGIERPFGARGAAFVLGWGREFLRIDAFQQHGNALHFEARQRAELFGDDVGGTDHGIHFYCEASG